MRIKAAGLSPNIDKQRERDILDVYSKAEIESKHFEPSVKPTISSDFTRNDHKLYEQYGPEPKTITQMYDVARASTATYVDATGKIRTAGVNEPRIDYSSGQGRLLVEGERTRLNTIAAAPTSPETIAVTAVAHTVSFYGTGSVALSGTHTATLTGTGLNQRVILTFTPTAGGLTLTPSGTVTDLQLEASARVSSVIRGEASAVTRAADNVSRVLGDEFNQDACTIYAEYYHPDASFSNAFSINSGGVDSGTPRFTLRNDQNAVRIDGTSFTSTALTGLASGFSRGDLVKCCISFDKSTGLAKGCVNGGDVATVSISNPSVIFDAVVIGGQRFSSGARLNESIKDIKVFPKALSDQECIQLTKV